MNYDGRRPSELGALAVVVVLIVLIVIGGYRVGDGHRDALARRDAAVLVTATETEILQVVDEEEATLREGRGTPVPAASGVPVLSAVTLTGALDGLEQPEDLLTAAARARDSGAAQMTAPLRAGGRHVVLLIVATYQGPAPQSTAQRRDALAGFVIGQVPLEPALEARAEPVRVTDGADVVADATGGSTRSGAQSATRRFQVLDREWRVEGWATAGFPTVVGVATVVAVLALLAAVVLVEAGRRRREAGDAALVVARTEGRLLTELAAVLQATLDLSDVCPAFATLVMEQLPVDGIALEVVRESGASHTVFAIGAPVDPAAPPTDVVAATTPPGSTVALAMERDRRLRGVLRLRVTGDLTPSDRRIAVVASQLAGAALDNALVHARQNETLQRLSELDELKTVFLGTAAHELRTPVTAIEGFSTMLRDRGDQLSPEQRELLVSRVAENASGLRLLVEDLLDFSRLDRGRMAGSSEPLELDDLVRDTVSRLAPLLAAHELDLVLEPGASLVADRAAVERVVTNLVSNAAKFSPQGSTIRVRVEVDVPDATCRLVVDDEGPGVPVAERARIFSRFYRGKGEEVVRTRGTGIGLAVVLELVRLLDGSVSVGESPSGGARFTVVLPLSSGPAPESAVPDEDEEPSHASSS